MEGVVSFRPNTICDGSSTKATEPTAEALSTQLAVRRSNETLTRRFLKSSFRTWNSWGGSEISGQTMLFSFTCIVFFRRTTTGNFKCKNGREIPGMRKQG